MIITVHLIYNLLNRETQLLLFKVKKVTKALIKKTYNKKNILIYQNLTQYSENKNKY